MDGHAIGILGLALCALACGIGSSLGLRATGSAAAGVLAEDPRKFSKLLVLVLLPATQGLYGLLIAFLGMNYLDLCVTVSKGLELLFAALPMAVVGFASALLQAKTAVAAIYTVAKKPEVSGKMILFPAMVETYALLALVISILLFGRI